MIYLDDNFPDHPKVLRAGEDAGWLFIAGLCYCRRLRTGGAIPKAAAPKLTRKRVGPLVAALVREQLWEDEGEYYRVHDYEAWNRSEARSEAGRRAAQARWSNRDANRNADPDANALPSQSRPNAIPQTTTNLETTPQPSSTGAALNGGESVTTLITEAVALIIQRDPSLQLRARAKDDPEAWLAGVQRKKIAAHRARAEKLLGRNPSMNATDLARKLEPNSSTPPTSSRRVPDYEPEPEPEALPSDEQVKALRALRAQLQEGS